MKERKRMWRTESKQDFYICSVCSGFRQPWQIIVSTLMMGQGQAYGTEYKGFTL